MRGGRWVIGLGLAVTLALLVAGAVLDPPAGEALSQWAQGVAEAAGAIACAMAAGYVRGRARLTWGLAASGLTLWAATDLAYGAALLAGAEVGDISPFDVGWLGFYVPMLGAVLLLYGRLRPERGWQGLLDGAVTVLALGLLAWVAVIRPAAAESSGGDLASFVALLYPALDLTGAAALAWVVYRHRGRAPRWLRLVATAFGLQVAGGVAYLVAQQRGLDGALVASAATYAAGGWLWVMAARERLARPERAWAPGRHNAPPVWSRAVPFGLVWLMAGVAAWGGGEPELVVPTLLAAAILTGRVLETLAINQGLLRERERLLVVDPLTGAFNRRFYAEEVDRAFARTARGHEQLALIAFDLDRFKAVNDTLGHGVGDQLLTAVCEAVSARLRLGDVLCRIGGDEFVVVAPEADLAGAVELAERLREAVRAAADRVVPGAGVTASLGVAVAPSQAQGPRDLLDRADAALYAAKAAGRDRVVPYDAAVRGPLGAGVASGA